MKILNCILASLIFILAITTIVFARKLDHKRFMIKTRGDQMKETSLSIAKNFDELLTIEVGAQITPNSLHHFRTKEQLASQYARLNEQFQAFSDYRNASVTELQKMATVLEIPTLFDATAANTRDKIEEAQRKIIDATNRLTQRDKANITACVELASHFSIQDVNEDKMANRIDHVGALGVFGEIGSNVDELWTLISTYEKALTRASSTFKTERPDFANDYAESIEIIVDAAGKLVPRINELDENIASSNTRIEDLDKSVAAIENVIGKLKEDLAMLEERIHKTCPVIGIVQPANLRKDLITPKKKGGLPYINEPKVAPPSGQIALNAPKVAPPPPMDHVYNLKNGTQHSLLWNEEQKDILLNELKCKVIGVSQKDQFVIVEGGLEAKVKQPGTDNEVSISIPQNAQGILMIIMRPGVKKPVFRGYVTISRVEKDRTFLNINRFPQVRTDIEVGDTAIFIPQDVTKVIDAAKKSIPEAPEPEVKIGEGLDNEIEE